MATLSRRSVVQGTALAAAGIVSTTGVDLTLAQSGTPAATPAASGPAFQVLFIRHAESEINVLPAGSDLPADDGVTYPLTTLGVQQAQALAFTLGNTELSALYTSTRLRCVQTADAIAFNTGRTLNLLPGIVETSFGTTSDLAEIGELLGRWSQGDSAAMADGGESLDDMRERFIPVVTEAIDAYAGDPRTLVFIAHGAILSLMLPFVFSNVTPGFAISNVLANTGIIRGAFDGGDLLCTDWSGVAPA